MKRTILSISVIVLLLPAVLLSSCSQDDTVSIDTYNIMYDHLSQVWAQSLAHADAETAFFGDSRVIGADWYTAFPDSKVVNLGVGGDRIRNLRTRMCQLYTMVSCGQLSCCFLAIGGNDCLSSSYDGTVFRDEYDALLTELQALGLTVYVNTVAGVTADGTSVSQKKADQANSRISEANTIIKELAALHGLPVIDIASEMNNEDGSLRTDYSTPDGVHFSEAGYACWYETLRPYVPV